MTTPPETAAATPAPADGLLHDQRRARRPETSVTLRRSDAHRVVAGVCGGIADYVGASPALVRTIFGLSLLPSIGVTGLGYLILWWLLPPAVG